MLSICWSESSLLPASRGVMKGDSISIAFRIFEHNMGSAIGTWIWPVGNEWKKIHKLIQHSLYFNEDWIMKSDHRMICGRLRYIAPGKYGKRFYNMFSQVASQYLLSIRLPSQSPKLRGTQHACREANSFLIEIHVLKYSKYCCNSTCFHRTVPLWARFHSLSSWSSWSSAKSRSPNGQCADELGHKIVIVSVVVYKICWGNVVRSDL